LNQSDRQKVFVGKFKKGYNTAGSSHKGSEVVIEYTREFIGELMCDYDMFWYPFDQQACAVELYQDEDLARLEPAGLRYHGPRYLTQYYVEGVSMCRHTVQVDRGIVGQELRVDILQQ
jgi:hypothetical protein